ncbi:MAG: hypothetical protein H6510_04520 [Acidobacteria bacterium]|nr:hypothetical protein [Acidobacteriota bacterium]MCB9397060.1 hypothetical protein [Acidobacteriota bacterium]
MPVRMAINGDNVAIKHEHGITLFNLSTGRPVSSFRISSPVSALYLSQEHVFLLTGSADKTMLQGYTYEGNHREGLFPYLDQYSAVKPQSQPMQGITQRLMMTGVIFEYDGVIGFVDNTLGNMAVYDRVRDSQRIETLLELYKPYGRKVKQLNGDFLQSGGVKSGELEMYKIWLAAKQVGKTLYCLEPGDPDHPGQPTLTAIRLVDKSKLFSRAIEVSAHGFFFHQQIPEINTMGPKLLRTQKFKVLGRERPHWKFTHWNT